MKLISVITPCYNEEKNVEELYLNVKEIFKNSRYRYEHIFIDNCSKDNTVGVLKKLASSDKNVKIIVNSRNFGWMRSHFYALTQARGDAAVLIFADLQDPPLLIEKFIKKWEEGYKIVLGIKTGSKESFVMYALRSLYYKIYKAVSENEIIPHCTGFGLYDKDVVDIFRNLNESYPFIKSLIAEIGFDKAIVEYSQEKRRRGRSSNNFYKLYDAAISGITSDSRVLIRMATMFGFAASAISFVIAAVYLILKLILWDRFQVGIASIAIGVFFFASLQLFFIGIIGEYAGAILTQVKKRPLVIEKERINF